VDEIDMLAALAPVADQLLERHLASSKEWFPHELVPWERAGTLDRRELLPHGVRCALVVNVLTEDALPYFTTGLYGRFGVGGPWWDWVRRWTAEEMRHGMVLHDYLSVTRMVDLVDLERRRLEYLAHASVPTASGVVDAFVYLALQELATRIAHANTARLLPDEAGRRVVARVAADEHLHHLFYRDLVGAALELSPSSTVIAIDQQVRHFSMPGHDLPDFAALAQAIADVGIYSTQVFLEHVVTPLVLGAWQIDELGSLSGPAAKARDRTLRFIERVGRIAPRLSGPTSAATGDDGGPRGSS
jgi:acyl-[acyl-carrier-protein] desaturase